MSAAYLREDSGENLDFLGQRSNFMVPIEIHASLSNHGHKIQNGVILTKAVVRTGAKHEPVLDLLLGITSDPSIGLERVRVRISFRVVQGEICSRDNHGA